MNFISFISSIFLLIAAVKAICSKRINKPSARAAEIREFYEKSGIDLNYSESDEKPPKHLTPEQIVTKRENVYRLHQHTVNLFNGFVKILDETNLKNLPATLDKYVEKNQGIFDIECVERMTNYLKKEIKGKSTKEAKKIVRQVSGEMQMSMNIIASHGNKMMGLSPEAEMILIDYDDEVVEKFLKKHPESPEAPIQNDKIDSSNSKSNAKMALSITKTDKGPKNDTKKHFYTQTWFLISVGCLVLVGMAVTVVLVMRTKKDATEL